MLARLVGLFVLLSFATAGSAQTLTWTKVAPKTSPPARAQHVMVYDSVRDRVVVFGGWLSGNASQSKAADDTWEFDGAEWKQLTPTKSPAPRWEAGAAFDPTRKVVVVFGGVNVSSKFGDTWEWNGSAWTKVSTTTAPSARDGHAMFYDPVLKKIVLFGGWNGSKTTNDTWTWDGKVWTKLNPKTMPSARNGASAVYDSSRNQAVLFGGQNVSKTLGDTWQWKGSGWSQIKVAGPSSRSFAAVGSAGSSGGVLLLGGQSGSVASGDAWWFNGSVWFKLSATASPTARWGGRLVCDSARQRLLLFGGRGSGKANSALNDMWSPKITTRYRWAKLSPTTLPAARAAHVMVYDSGRDRLVVFGGWLGLTSAKSNIPANDTWEFNGTNWAQLKPSASPSPRWECGGAYDPVRKVVVIYGGRRDHATLSDTWEWNGASWTSIKVSGPSARYGHNMFFDPTLQKVILLGGTSSIHKPTDDAWSWNGKTWSKLTITAALSPRSAAGLAYDSAGKRAVLFGGWNGSKDIGDTWEWKGSGWRNLKLTGPSARHWPELVFDEGLGRTIMFAGFQTPSLTPLGDTWLLDANGWQQVLTRQAPSTRWGTAFAYDSKRKRTLLLGGRADLTKPPLALADMWSFGTDPSSFMTFGSGCAGASAVPALSSTTPPRIGKMFTLYISNLKPLTTGLLVLGGSNTEWNGSKLPLGLSFMGMNGCKLLVSWEVTIGIFSQAGGTLQWSPTIPNEKALVGRAVFAQAWVIDASANPLGVATSNGAKALIGN